MNMNIKPFSLLLLANLLFAEQSHLQHLTVVCEDEDSLEDSTHLLTHTLSHESKGESLGEYLENSLGISNNSFGPAVGRPSYHGLDAKRLGITEGTHAINDLSSLSSDHAVGVVVRNQEEIHLLRTTEALLYGAYSGGIVQLLSNSNSDTLPKKNFSLRSTLEHGSNGAASIKSLHLEAKQDTIALYSDISTISSDNFRDGNNKLIQDSFSEAKEYRFVVGYQPTNTLTLKLFSNTLYKDYGIPNSSSEASKIDLQKKEFGAVAHIKEAFSNNKEVEISIKQSEYNHFELENNSKDGRFDQSMQSLSVKSDFVFDKSELTHHISFSKTNLEVCHAHGTCDTFDIAPRTEINDGESLKESVQNFSYAFAHTHPMPSTQTQTLLNALYYKLPLEYDELSFSIHHVNTNIKINANNIDESYLYTLVDGDFYDTYQNSSYSSSLSWWHLLNETYTSTLSLSSISRTPSSDELLFNGFHHATNSYNIGNRDLENEKSLQIELDLEASYEYGTFHFNSFYYHFNSYIYQSLIKDESNSALYDPFHNSIVYHTNQGEATLYGTGISHTIDIEHQEHTYTFDSSLNLLRGTLSNGENIPRMMPDNINLSFSHNFEHFKNSISVKAVHKARYLAQLETPTQAYLMTSLQTSYHNHYHEFNYSVWLKGENLNDTYATNHLSYLKASSPYPGRQIKFGAELTF
jgi:iron complex outermembrane recepter protein